MAILILEEKTKEVYHCICIVWSTIFTRDFIRLLRNQFCFHMAYSLILS
jgi:hypothetical protein